MERSKSPASMKSPHILLAGARSNSETAPLTYAPIKKPIALTDSRITLDVEIGVALGNGWEYSMVMPLPISHDAAARKLLGMGAFDILNRMASERIIHDWENLARFALFYAKDKSLSVEETAKRVEWVFSRATTNDIAVVASEYMERLPQATFASFDKTFDELHAAGFPRDLKTKMAMNIAYGQPLVSMKY
jgi:hypothetical protein